MATLAGQKIQDSYKTILKTESTVGFSGSTPTRIEDGDGNQSALYLGKTKASVVGSLSLNLSSVSTPRANLHIVGTGVQAMLVQNTSGYNKFYVGDHYGAYNVKMGDIDSTSTGNNTYLYISDSNQKIASNASYFGVNQLAPTATLHVGRGESTTALFDLGTGTDVFKITTPTNSSLLSIDQSRDKIVVNASIEMTGTGSFRRPSQRIELEEYFAQLPRPYLYATETKDWGSIADGDEEVEEVTVTGAELGDYARASFGLDVEDLELSAQVTAANTVTVTLSNNTGGGIDLGSSTLFVQVDERTNIEKNPNIMITGTNADGVGSDVLWDTHNGGLIIITDGADNDQVVLFPRGAAAGDPLNSSSWASDIWQSDSQVQWDCAIKTHSSIADMAIFAGLKLTAVGVAATDDDQAYFLYSSNDDMATLTTNGNLHFVYSVGGSDIITDLGIALAADTIYRLRVEIDSNRQVSVYVNETQYGLATTAKGGGDTQTVSTTKSNALTTNIALKATVGIQALTSSAKSLYVFYERISRVIGS